MHRFPLLALAALLAIPTASAQLSGLFGGRENRAAASADAPFPPAVVYQELLPQLRVDEGTGRFGLGFFVLAFPDSDRAKMIIRDDRGKEVWTRGYRGQRDGTRTTLRFTTDSGGSRFGLGRRRAMDPPVFEESGDYVFEIENGGDVVSRLPFRIEKLMSDDPYADTPPRYVMTGIWQSHVFFDYDDTNDGKQPALRLNFFDHHLDPDRESIHVERERIELRRDGRLIGRNVRDDTSIRKGRSIRTQEIETTLRENTGYHESRVLRSDMTDGTYELRRSVKADDYNGGSFTQTVTFEIRDGKFVPVGDQVREGTEPAAFIEGLNRAFFYPITTTR